MKYLTRSELLCLARRLTSTLTSTSKPAKVLRNLARGRSSSKTFLVPIASFVQTKTMDAITDRSRVDVFGSTAMTTGAKNDVDGTAESSPGTEHRLVRDLKALVRKAVKVVSHAKPATVSAVAPDENGKTNHVSRTQQCRCVTPTPRGMADPPFCRAPKYS